MNNTESFAIVVESISFRASELTKECTNLLRRYRERKTDTITYRMQDIAANIGDIITTLEHLKNELIQPIAP